MNPGERSDPAPPPAGHWTMPAEWAPHDGCVMAWPTRRGLWGGVFEEAKREYAAVADAIAAFEPVLMVAAPGATREIERMVASQIEVVELPLDDSWMRDAGPIFVLDGRGGRAGVDFRFNSWGERFLPYADDALVGERLLAHLAIECHSSELVLEGGSITVDGEGTLITTEQCLLNPNRNPGRSREQIETELRRTLGVETIIWLPYGHADDSHTDGHVDGVCTYVRPGAVIVQACNDPAHPDHQRMRANRAVLDRSIDAQGRSFEVIELPFYPYLEVDGERTMVSYVNLYLANGGVIVPTAGHPHDEQALATIAVAFPDRETVGVESSVIAYGGGGAHCITQQLPAKDGRA